MSERKYCPMLWCDEVVAVSVPDPSDCIVCDNGKWLMADDDWRDGDRHVGQSIELTPGEVVRFGHFETRGRVTVIKHDDGSFSHDGAIPTDATSWWEAGNPDTMSDSLEEFVRECMDPGGQVTVEAYRWEFNVPFVFEVDGETGKFVPCVSA